MKFNKQIRKAEGQKIAKVELTISIDGVAIQEPRLKVIQHRYPLHRISYCADDKSDKRMFTFVAKEGESNYCFVFDSEKCPEKNRSDLEVPVVGRRLENLVFTDNKETASPINGTVSAAPPSGMHMPVLAPPPPGPSRCNIPSTPPTLQPSEMSQSSASGQNTDNHL
ncbi:PTB domain-containing engulfment adapter protein 1 [Lamellibrachia satsuma]|nr:PTB domain-containing engulfment adapter protein 1 [Lamellibrachia satsuma]